MMLTRAQLLSYGLFGLPLALVALPVYVMVPQLYAGSLGMPLAMVGAILLGARVLDAFIDPLLGRWMDRSRYTRGYASFVLLSLPLLAVGFIALMLPPALSQEQLAAWFGASLVLVYGGYSLATIAHNSWGASLTQQRGERARLTATREGCALVGVVLAAILPPLTGLAGVVIAFVVLLLAGAMLLLKHSPRASSIRATDAEQGSWLLPLTVPRFRWLCAVYAMNGIAAAVPATLFLFFASDRLQLPQYAALFLLLYFASGGLALPLWTRLAGSIGEARTWLLAMLLAVVAFTWTAQLSAGALLPFAIICVLTGATLGADLALPPALLAGVIGAAGHGGEREGSYFGVWSWITKMNLALAAGISLPLLEWLGYTPGATDEAALSALTIAYAVLPCVLKAGAALLLWRAPLNDV
jgi:GPH family glycoside/pentoside/hexuronide:cation symporter